MAGIRGSVRRFVPSGQWDSCRETRGPAAGVLPPRVRSSGWRLPRGSRVRGRDARDAPRRSPETGPRRAPVDRLLGRAGTSCAPHGAFSFPSGGAAWAASASRSSSLRPASTYRADTYATKDPRRFEWLRARLEDDDVLFDVGANVGLYSLYRREAQARVPRLRLRAGIPQLLEPDQEHPRQPARERDALQPRPLRPRVVRALPRLRPGARVRAALAGRSERAAQRAAHDPSGHVATTLDRLRFLHGPAPDAPEDRRRRDRGEDPRRAGAMLRVGEGPIDTRRGDAPGGGGDDLAERRLAAFGLLADGPKRLDDRAAGPQVARTRSRVHVRGRPDRARPRRHSSRSCLRPEARSSIVQALGPSASSRTPPACAPPRSSPPPPGASPRRVSIGPSPTRASPRAVEDPLLDPVDVDLQERRVREAVGENETIERRGHRA